MQREKHRRQELQFLLDDLAKVIPGVKPFDATRKTIFIQARAYILKLQHEKLKLRTKLAAALARAEAAEAAARRRATEKPKL